MAPRAFGAAAAALWLLVTPADAQVSMGAATSPGVTIQRDAAPPAQPAPPHGPLFVPPAPPSRIEPVPHDSEADLFRAGPRTYAPRYDRRTRRPPYGGGLPGYGYADVPYAPDRELNERSRPSPPAEPGYLRLDILPLTAHVYIDGYFVGAAEEFGWTLHPLEAGPHRIEVRADGYEPVAVDVRIRPYDTLTFARELSRERIETAPAVAPRRVAQTLYVIPRCYAGTRRPDASDLPAGCSLAAMRTIAPPSAP